MSTSISCRKCGRESAKGSSTCRVCGEKICPECGDLRPQGAALCDLCERSMDEWNPLAGDSGTSPQTLNSPPRREARIPQRQPRSGERQTAQPEPRRPAATQSQNTIRGTVRNFQTRSEQKRTLKNPASELVWTWVITTFDDQGAQLNQIPVEMRARSIRGVLTNGDEVEIKEKYKPGRLVVPVRVYNHTTDSWIDSGSGGKRAAVIVFIVALLGMLGFLLAQRPKPVYHKVPPIPTYPLHPIPHPTPPGNLIPHLPPHGEPQPHHG